MTDMKRYKLHWNGETIGYIENPVSDMGYLEGAWIPIDNDKTCEFERLVAGRTFHDFQMIEDINEHILLGFDKPEEDYLFVCFLDGSIVIRAIPSIQDLKDKRD